MTHKETVLLSLVACASAGGGAALANDIAQCWLKIVRKFTPLIGASSVLLIVERSVASNLAGFPWLPRLARPMQLGTSIEQLRTSMSLRSDDDMRASHHAILAAFIDLMATLIGIQLTVQFLHAAFPDSTASDTEEISG